MRPTVLAPSTRAPRDHRGRTLALTVAALTDASAATTAHATSHATAPRTEDPYTVTARRRVRALNRIQQHLQSYAAPRS